MKAPFSGIITATITPYKDSGEVDTDALVSLIKHLASCGIEGFLPLGTTGEFPMLDAKEKIAVIEAACRAAGKTNPVITGVWAQDRTERSLLVRTSQESGARGIFLTTPIYYPATRESLLEWYRSVKRETTLPLLAYNIPQFSGNEIPIDVLNTLADEGTIQGYKESSPDKNRLKDVFRALQGRISVFCGNEVNFVRAYEMGMDGFMSMLGNVFPKTVVAVTKGDRRRFKQLMAALEIIQKNGGISAIKYIAKKRGFGNGEGRDLLPPLDAESKVRLDRFFQYVPEME